MAIEDAVLRFPFAGGPHGEPPDEYAQLRAESPVTPVVLASGSRAWLVTRYADIRTVLTDDRFSRSIGADGGPRISSGIDPYLDSALLIHTDPPDHGRLRSVVQRAFKARAVQTLHGRMRVLAEDLADELIAAGPPADLVRDFAFPYVGQITAELLGIPDPDVERIKAWTEVISSVTRHTKEDMRTASQELGAFVGGLLALKRSAPGDDVLSVIAAARLAGEIDDHEMILLARTLTFGGYGTVTNVLTRGVLLLLRHPDQLALLRERPALIPAAVEEILRCSMVGGNGLSRIAVTTEDVVLSGVRIGRGETVISPLTCANRDPAVFAAPDRFDITRDDVEAHLAFGHGRHFCLGGALSRLELGVALETLFRRLPGLRLATSPGELRWTPDLLLDQMDSLPAEW
ncbi:cytochrome P450 [Lentzea sp. NPDC051208]|uniref:cytochrome P450 n=1 Tax=Lentzea sp. NPDC051208 TaxID=3154642 RepID=UPI0034229296